MFAKWLMKRAAKRYALTLRPWLARQYGGAEYYTVPQIQKGIGALKLNPKFTAIAYAAFLTEPDYNRLKSDLPRVMEFREARALFMDYEPIKLQSRHSGSRKKR